VRFSSPKNAPNSKFSRCGSLQRSLRPPSWWGTARCPSPRTPSPLSALRTSSVGGFSGLALTIPTFYNMAPPMRWACQNVHTDGHGSLWQATELLRPRHVPFFFGHRLTSRIRIYLANIGLNCVATFCKRHLSAKFEGEQIFAHQTASKSAIHRFYVFVNHAAMWNI